MSNKTKEIENRKHKVYKIDSWKKLHNVVNKDNFTMFMIDFANYLGFYVHNIDVAKENNPEVDKLSNFEILQSEMKWIDDEKNDFDCFEVENQITGEVKEYKIGGHRDLSTITEEEQIEAEFHVYGVVDPVGLLTLEEFKESLLGTNQDLRMTFLDACKMYDFLKGKGFKIPFS